MTKYRMDNGSILNTDNATQSWREDTTWDGNNHISKATGSQWEHQKLYRSKRGRYYTEHISQWQGSTPHCEWVSEQEACRWLLLMGHELPDELEQHRDEIEE